MSDHESVLREEESRGKAWRAVEGGCWFDGEVRESCSEQGHLIRHAESELEHPRKLGQGISCRYDLFP